MYFILKKIVRVREYEMRRKNCVGKKRLLRWNFKAHDPFSGFSFIAKKTFDENKRAGREPQKNPITLKNSASNSNIPKFTPNCVLKAELPHTIVYYTTLYYIFKDFL